MHGTRSNQGIARLFCVILLLWPALAGACDDDDADGLDVGLVLSGGGALATTHVGALTVIQELGVPIHCVVGTSMGSVVGALYAAGYDADALRGIFRDSRWPEVFNGVVPRNDQSYLRKEQDDLYLSGYVAGLTSEGVRLPGGFRPMNGLAMLFRQHLLHVPPNADFDHLQVPFRAVATNLSTGAAVPFDHGDLVEAMLASMAVPGVFAPRDIDGTIFVDGGMSAQLPVEVIQAMGADVIIALDTTVEPPLMDTSVSLGGVTQQLIRLQVWGNWQASAAKLGPADVLIRPDLARLTTSSFEHAETGFAAGETEAEQFREQLLRIRESAAPALPRQTPTMPRHGPDTLVVDNQSVLRDSLIANRFDYDPEAVADPVHVQHRLRDLASFGPFGEADLALDQETAVLRVKPLGLGRNLLETGFRASNNFQGDSTYQLLGRYSRRPLGANGSDLRVSAQVGTDLGLAVELYYPFGPASRFFALPGLAYWAEDLIFDLNDLRIGEFWQQTAEARLRFGREIGDWGIIAVDGLVSTERTSTIVSISPENFGTFESKYAGFGVLLGLDTLNRTDWPNAGFQLRLAGQKLKEIGNEASDTDKVQFLAAKPWKLPGLSMLLKAEAEGVYNDEDLPTDVLRLGGFRRLTAYPENSLLNTEYALGSIEVYRRLTNADAVVSLPVFVGALVEYANVELTILEGGVRDELWSLGAYVGAETPLGPFFLGAGFGDGTHTVFMHFGRSF